MTGTRPRASAWGLDQWRRRSFADAGCPLRFAPLFNMGSTAARSRLVTQFSVPWRPKVETTDLRFGRKSTAMVAVFLVVTAIGWWVTRSVCDGHPAARLLFIVCPLLAMHAVILAKIAVRWWKPIEPLLIRFAFFILVGTIVGFCVLTWVTNVLFAWVTAGLVESASNDPSVLSWFGAPLTLVEITAAIPGWLPGWTCCLIWPLQYPFVRDLVALGAIVGIFVGTAPAYFIWWERKAAGRIQSRVGLMRTGKWHGWAQSPADGLKLLLKEDLVPGGADKVLFRAAPYFAFVPAALAFVALPFGVTYIFRDTEVSLVFVLGMLGIEVVGVILAGWASNNKWSIYGAMREACQMISYEIPMGMSLLIPVVCAGTLSLARIGELQSGGWFTWLAFRNPFTFVAFVCYFITSLASCKRAPFDLPEGESELVAGFLTEYSGLRWGLFFLGEYAAMLVVSALAVILFLGAWNSPFPTSWGDRLGDGILAQGLKGVLFGGPVWFVAKAFFFVFVQIWVRWTLPRIRIDQVLYACVQVLLPLTMLLLMGATLWTWASTSESRVWATLDLIANITLGLVGMVFVAGFVGIAGYGYYHRRRLVGYLAVDALPGG